MKGFFKRLYNGWMVFAHKLGVVQSTIMLFIIYFLGIGVTWFFCFILRRDLLGKSLKDRASFWHERDFKTPTLQECERQF